MNKLLACCFVCLVGACQLWEAHSGSMVLVSTPLSSVFRTSNETLFAATHGFMATSGVTEGTVVFRGREIMDRTCALIFNPEARMLEIFLPK